MNITIGTWNEKASRKLTEFTSYAADSIQHETVPGEYPLVLVVESGYSFPMPYWLCTGIASNVVGGGYFSGFAGNNFAFSEAKKGPSKYCTQLYFYHLKRLVESGDITLKPEWQFLVASEDYAQTLQALRSNPDWNWESLSKFANK